MEIVAGSRTSMLRSCELMIEITDALTLMNAARDEIRPEVLEAAA
jgi:hypothetical protein